MAAIDTVRTFAPQWQQSGRRSTTLALAGTAIALAVAALAFLYRGGDHNGVRYAAQMVFRASSVVFLLYYLAQPLARLIPTRPTLALARQRMGLALAFAGSYAVFVACSLAPDYMNGAPVALTTLGFAIFSAVVLSVMLMGEYGGRATDPAWRAAWRAMESIGVAYFWVVYAVSDLDHLSGPHRPDGFYGASLVVLCLAVLVRFADAFRQRYRLLRA